MISNMDIHELRKHINTIDEDILNLIIKRFEYTRQVGAYKADNDLPSYDPEREKDVQNHWERRVRAYNIDENMAKNVITTIMKTVVTEHNQQRNQKS